MRNLSPSRGYEMELRPGLKPAPRRLLAAMAVMATGVMLMLAGIIGALVA